jgi:hypothetical protein
LISVVSSSPITTTLPSSTTLSSLFSSSTTVSGVEVEEIAAEVEKVEGSVDEEVEEEVEEGSEEVVEVVARAFGSTNSLLYNSLQDGSNTNS